MIPWQGDFPEDATVLIPFNTFSSDDPSASVTITNLADADLKVHKDGSTTEIVTDGATIAIDFDGITGNHLATIDTSAHADYSTGSDYHVRMEGTTVDGATINAWIGSFSIENRYNGVNVESIDDIDAPATWKASINSECDTAIETYKLDHLVAAAESDDPVDDSIMAKLASATGDWSTFTAGTHSLEASQAEHDATQTSIADVPTTAEFEARTLVAASYFDPAADAVANVTTVGTLTGHTAQTGDTYALANGAAGFVAIDTVVDAIKADLDDGGRLDLIFDAILADTAELQTDWTNGGRLDLIIDAVLADTNELQSDDYPTRFDTLDSAVAAVDSNVDAILLDTGTDGVAISASTIDSIHDEPVTEPSGRPSWASMTHRKIQQTLGVLMLNEINSDSDSVDVRNDADDGTLWSYPSSDDGTTYTSGEAA